jgi:hypothetical protein
MRKVDDGRVLEFNEITDVYYRSDYSVVEVVSIDHNTGEKMGKVLWVCESYEEALSLSVSLEGIDSMVLPGLACYSVLGGCFV